MIILLHQHAYLSRMLQLLQGTKVHDTRVHGFLQGGSFWKQSFVWPGMHTIAFFKICFPGFIYMQTVLITLSCVCENFQKQKQK